MQIEALRLCVTEDDLNELVSRAASAEPRLSNPRVHILDGGISLTGTFKPLWLGIPFEVRLLPVIEGQRVAVRVTRLRAVGFPLTVLKGLLLSAIGKAAGGEPSLQVQDGALVLDLDQLLRDRGLPLRTNLTAIRCGAGALWVEASGPAPG